jgi:hypothetical protein
MIITQHQIDKAETDDILLSLNKKSLVNIFEKLGIEIGKKLKNALGATKNCVGCPSPCEDASMPVHNLDVIKESMVHFPSDMVRNCVIGEVENVMKNKYGITKIPA